MHKEWLIYLPLCLTLQQKETVTDLLPIGNREARGFQWNKSDNFMATGYKTDKVYYDISAVHIIKSDQKDMVILVILILEPNG